MKPNKGFTLIELLVVIAIIGILSAVVLAALNDARGRASDTAIKSQLSNIRAEAEMYYDNNALGGYTGLCTSPGFQKLYVASINNARWGGVSNGVPATNNNNYACSANNLGYAVSVRLLNSTASSGSYDFWCVDGDGTPKLVQAATAAGTMTAGSATAPIKCN